MTKNLPVIFLFLFIIGCKPVKNDPIVTQVVIDKNKLSRFIHFELEDKIVFPYDFSLNEYIDSFLLDMNNNDVADFIFRFSYFRNLGSYQVSLELIPLDNNQVAAGNSKTITGMFPALPLSEQDTLNNRFNWQNQPVLMYEASGDEFLPFIGLCFMQSDKFLGIKVNINSKDYFGWIHFSTFDNFLEIESFALSKYQASWW